MNPAQIEGLLNWGNLEGEINFLWSDLGNHYINIVLFEF